MTECKQESFRFTAHFSRRVESEFTAGRVSSDGGALLLREADRKIHLLGRLASCFIDGRSPLLVKHPLPGMLAQRIYVWSLNRLFILAKPEKLSLRRLKFSGDERMNIHKNARLTPIMREQLVRQVVEQGLSRHQAAIRFQVSSNTAGKWVRRHHIHGT